MVCWIEYNLLGHIKVIITSLRLIFPFAHYYSLSFQECSWSFQAVTITPLLLLLIMPPKCPKLLDVEHLSSTVIRVLGQNPGPRTLQGTNTYLVGKGPEVILIDTGAGLPEYKTLLAQTISSLKLNIVSVVLTHWHADHVGGVADVESLATTPLDISKYPHHSDETTYAKLSQGDRLNVSGATLTVHHTPGHTDDSISLWHEEEKSLFCADTILGGSSSVYDNYNLYLKTLNRYLELSPARLYPGHGEVIEDAEAAIRHTIKHRQDREESVLRCLREAGGGVSIKELTAVVYKDDGLNEMLFFSAMYLVRLYLEKFAVDGTAVDRGDDVWEKL